MATQTKISANKSELAKITSFATRFIMLLHLQKSGFASFIVTLRLQCLNEDFHAAVGLLLLDGALGADDIIGAAVTL